VAVDGQMGRLKDDELMEKQDEDDVDLSSAIQKVSDIVTVECWRALNLVTQLHAICRLTRSSSQRSEDFQEAITTVNNLIRRANRDRADSNRELELKSLVLILDVVTRWNSTYFMIEHAFGLHKVRFYCCCLGVNLILCAGYRAFS
jgi:hypothetical protein